MSHTKTRPKADESRSELQELQIRVACTGKSAADALEELGRRTFAIARDIPVLDALRISIGFFTSDEELERFCQGVELLASHTPETIPPRRTLAMLGES